MKTSLRDREVAATRMGSRYRKPSGTPPKCRKSASEMAPIRHTLTANTLDRPRPVTVASTYHIRTLLGQAVYSGTPANQ